MSLQVHKLSDTLYQFNESADFAGNGQLRPYVDAYLLIGTKHAALIDCLQNVTGLYDEIRKLTSLPIDVLITHGHGDHAGLLPKNLPRLAARSIWFPKILPFFPGVWM